MRWEWWFFNHYFYIFISRTMHIIFISDSRGVMMLPHIKCNLQSHIVTDIIMPGATVDELISESTQFIHQTTTPSIIIFSGGIFSLTTGVKHQGGKEIVYDHSFDNIQQIMDSLTTFVHHIKTYTPHVPIITTIPPIHIQTYNHHLIKTKKLIVPLHYHDITHQMQLEHATQIINRIIIQLNVGACPILEHNMNRVKNNTISYRYTKLYDGVHPTKKLAQKWGKVIGDSVNKVVEWYFTSS